jgi:hypothetical protein
MFYQYVWQEYGKFAEYRANTAFLFVREGLDQLLAIGPPDFRLAAEKMVLPLASVFLKMKEWLGSEHVSYAYDNAGLTGMIGQPDVRRLLSSAGTAGSPVPP